MTIIIAGTIFLSMMVIAKAGMELDHHTKCRYDKPIMLICIGLWISVIFAGLQVQKHIEQNRVEHVQMWKP